MATKTRVVGECDRCAAPEYVQARPAGGHHWRARGVRLPRGPFTGVVPGRQGSTIPSSPDHPCQCVPDCPVQVSNRTDPFADGDTCCEPSDPRDQEDRCGLHGEFDKTPEECLKWFRKRVEVCPDDASHVDFTRCIFPDRFALPIGYEFPKPPNFRKAKFGDGVSFHDAVFGDNAWFHRATFGDETDFECATFGDRAGFEFATFGDCAWFRGATFGDDAWFTGATFNGRSFFIGARIQGKLLFDHATLKGISKWNKVRLAPSARVVWTDSEILSDLRFDNLRFPTPEAAFDEDLERWAKEAEKAKEARRKEPRKPERSDKYYEVQSPDVRIDFRDVPTRVTTNIRFQGTDTDDSQDHIDCSKILFAHTDVSRIRFHNAKWDNEPAWRRWPGSWLHPRRRIARVADDDYLSFFPGTQEPKVDADEQVAPSLVADVYKGLRVTYEDHLRQADAGRFHVREMEMRRLGLKTPSTDIRGDTQFWRVVHGIHRRMQAAGLSLYRWTSLYGESLVLPVLWLLAWIVLFGWLLQSDLPDLPPLLASLHDTFATGLGLAPTSVTGRNGVEFLGRVGGVYFVTVAVVALRRQFRRHRGGL